MVTRYAVGLVWSLLAGLAGGWLVLSPWALGQQGGGNWSDVTVSQFWSGVGLIALALIGAGMVMAGLLADLREAGIVRQRQPAPRPAAPPQEAAEAQQVFSLLAKALADELDRREQRRAAPGRESVWESQR